MLLSGCLIGDRQFAEDKLAPAASDFMIVFDLKPNVSRRYIQATKKNHSNKQQHYSFHNPSQSVDISSTSL
jgi:hypothetical protein